MDSKRFSKILSMVLIVFSIMSSTHCIAATATSTGSGKWSQAIWTGGSGSGGAPGDGDAVVIAAGHSVQIDVDLSEWTGLTFLTITGSESGTPGMLYWKDGNSGTLKFRNGSESGNNYGIRGTNVANKGRLLANSDGVWGNTGQLAFSTKALILLDGTSQISATYLDIQLYCHEPSNRYLTTYYDKYDVASEGIDTTTNVITLASSHGWSANRAVKVKSTGTLPAPLTELDIYYVGSPLGANLTLLYTSGGAEVDITSVGSGTITIYSGYETYTSVTQLNVFEDVTADTGWTATDEHDAVVLVDIAPAVDYDQQRTTIASIDSATQVTLAAALDSAQYPGAQIWLSSRNVSIRSSSTSSTQAIVSAGSGNMFGCEIKNTAGSGNTFYGHALNGSNNTISGVISGCNMALNNVSNNNTISGAICGCNYALNGSNNTISGVIRGCNYEVRGNSIKNYLMYALNRSEPSFYSNARNTVGVESRTGLQTPSTEAVYDAWGTIQKVAADGTDQPSQRSGGSSSVLQIDAQSNISASYKKLSIFEHNIWIPAAGSRTITYYAQSNYTSGLTADQVKLTCQYLSSADNNTLTSVTSTQGVTIRDDEDDWDQYLQVTVAPAKAGYVTCRSTLAAYESGKYLWIDPMLVTTGLTIVPRWYGGESLVEAYTTPVGGGGGGKWVY